MSKYRNNFKPERVSGRVLAIEHDNKDYNKLFIGSHKFGTMIVKAILPDKDIEGLQRNDNVQLAGKVRIRKRIADDGMIVRDVLVMKPVLEHIIRTKKIAEWHNPSQV